MDRKAAMCILDVQERIQSDQGLMCEYRKAHEAFLEMLPRLTKNQQEILTDYLGVCIEIHLRMLTQCIEEK